MTQLDTWTGCYDLGWQNILTPAAFSHPAKFSRGLIFRIVEHAIEEGWVQSGGVILDPFSGVACGALPCLQYGLNYVGVELEEKFVTLARENIALWNARYAAHFPNWGSAQVLQGDSRRLAEVVGAAGLVVGSPPFTQTQDGGAIIKPPEFFEHPTQKNASRHYDVKSKTDGYGSTPGQLATLPPGTPPLIENRKSKIQNPVVISSPPFAGNSGGRGEASRNGIDPGLFDRHSGGMKKGTGDDPANLDHLPMGSIGAVIGSPPYVDSMEASGGIDPAKSNHIGGPHSQMNRSDTRYGKSDGQMGAMKAGDISAVISSPPFADSVGSDDPDKRGGLFRDEKRRNDTNLTGTYGETEGQLGAMKAGAAVISSPPYATGEKGHPSLGSVNKDDWGNEGTDIAGRRGLNGDYGSTDGQLATGSPDTFWAAAKTIVEQCALLLPVGGAAIFVVKGYIKNGKYVDFPGQWQQLCEACGFETVHVHRAMLVEENGAQGNMFGENKKNKVERKSFFRRMFEATQKAAKHWLTLGRDDQAAVLWATHNLMWALYRASLAIFEAGEKDEKDPPPRPSDKRILHEAKMTAWVRDGKIDYEIETSIDFETVLCMRKAA